MRITSSVTSVSWIPSEAVPGVMKVPFESGLIHYDEPLPDELGDLEGWRAADRFRFANHLSVAVEVTDDGQILDASYTGGGMMGATTLRVGGRSSRYPAVAFPDLQRPPVRGQGWVRFVQTTGGQAGILAPRPVSRPPFLRVAPPVVWTTLALVVYADGRVEHELIGASPFPRHWIYDETGRMVAKSGYADYKKWSETTIGGATPWSRHEEPALVSAAESALERSLSTQIMRGGARPTIRQIPPGDTLVEQGRHDRQLFLLLNGMLTVEIDGAEIAEVGPGAILGERAVLEGGARTATLRAATPCTVAVARGADLDPGLLTELSAGHRREDELSPRGLRG